MAQRIEAMRLQYVYTAHDIAYVTKRSVGPDLPELPGSRRWCSMPVWKRLHSLRVGRQSSVTVM